MVGGCQELNVLYRIMEKHLFKVNQSPPLIFCLSLQLEWNWWWILLYDIRLYMEKSNNVWFYSKSTVYLTFWFFPLCFIRIFFISFSGLILHHYRDLSTNWTFFLWYVPLIKVWITELALIHKNIRSVHISHAQVYPSIHQSEVKHIITSPIKKIT